MGAKQPAQAVRRRTRSVDIETDLLVAADRLLAESGPDALTVRAVATAAGVAPMGVYNRFDGKHGLLEALFIKGFDELRADVAAATGTTALARLRNGCLAYREYAIGHPQYYRLMFDRMHEVEPSEEALIHAFDSFGELVSRCAAAVASGQIAPAGEVEIAQQLWNGMHGAVILELSGIGFTENAALTYQSMLDTMLRGLAAT